MNSLPLQPSFCDNTPRPPGVGFVPPPGSLSRLYSLPNAQGVAGSHPMDLSAHGFGDTHTYSMEQQRRRYGPNFHGTDESLPRFLALDFESLFGVGSIHLSKLACAGRFGSDVPTRLSCYPTLEELHDFYACYPEEASAALGTSGGGSVSARQPGVPVIQSINTREPGVVEVRFVAARKGHNLYEVGVWEKVEDIAPLLSVPVAGSAIIAPGREELTARVEIPSGLSAQLSVRVRAFIGGAAGRWSLASVVIPKPKLPTPPVPAPSEPAPPDAPPTVPPAVPPSGTRVLDIARLNEAAAAVRRALPDPGKGGLPLQRLAGEVRKLLAILGSEGSK